MDKTLYYSSLLGKGVEIVYSKFGEDEQRRLSGVMYSIITAPPEESYFISIGIKTGGIIKFVNSDTNRIISVQEARQTRAVGGFCNEV